MWEPSATFNGIPASHFFFFLVYARKEETEERKYNSAFTYSFPRHGRSLLADVAAEDPYPLLLRRREKRTGRQRVRCPLANNGRHAYRTVQKFDSILLLLLRRFLQKKMEAHLSPSGLVRMIPTFLPDSVCWRPCHRAALLRHHVPKRRRVRSIAWKLKCEAYHHNWVFSHSVRHGALSVYRAVALMGFS